MKMQTCQICGSKFEPNRMGPLRVLCTGCRKKRHLEQRRASKVRNGHVKSPEWFMDRTCTVCGKTFMPKRYNQTACSHECSEKRRRVADESRICMTCGNPFDPKGTRRLYCSYACAYAAERRQARTRYVPSTSKEKRRSSHEMRLERLRRKVEEDMRLPPSERFERSRSWTPDQRMYAQKLYEIQHSLFTVYRPSTI